MKKYSRLGLVCKIIAGYALLVCVAKAVLTVGNYVAVPYLYSTFWLMVLAAFSQFVSGLIPAALLWAAGVLLDRQKRQSRELERIAALLEGRESQEQTVNEEDVQWDETF